MAKLLQKIEAGGFGRRMKHRRAEYKRELRIEQV
jgi:hypothetical protein